jgi:N-acetylglucosamine kinase-like BadF-type ATPase
LTAVLAIDLGKTGCRAALWRGGQSEPDWSGSGAGVPGLAAVGGLEAAGSAIASVCRAVLEDAELSCCVGAAGAGAAPGAAAALLGSLLRSWPHAAVCSDAVIAHAGALAGEPGVLLLAGTGAVALAIDGSGMAQADGWGPLLDDAGGGGWIGAAGLRAVLRSVDGRGAPTALTEAAVELFGPVTDLARLVGGQDNPARLLASFAPLVARAAESGDPIAGRIIATAAAELAGSALAAAGRLAVSAVALAGGLWNLGPTLTEPVVRALEDGGLQVSAALGDPLAGARLLAMRPDTVLEPFVLRAAGSAGRPTVP